MSVSGNRVSIRPRDVVRDVPSYELPPEAWSAAVNVNWRRGVLERVGGLSAVFNTRPALPLHLQSVLSGEIPYWLYPADDTRIYVTDGDNHFDVTPGGFVEPSGISPYTSTLINGFAVLNWFDQAPHYWPGGSTDALVPLPGWPAGATCRSIRAFQGSLFALGVNDGVTFNPNLVTWSDTAAPGSVPDEWTPAAGNNAGFFELSEGLGGLFDGAPLRQSLYLYKRSRVEVCDFIGGNFVFRRRPVFTESGALGTNCVVQFGGRHYVFGEGDIYAHDGQSQRSLITERWRREVFDTLPADKSAAAFVALYAAQNEVWFVYPDEADTRYPSNCLVYNYVTDQVGYRRLNPSPHAAPGIIAATDLVPLDWDSQTATWDAYPGIWDATPGVAGEDRLLLADRATGFLYVDLGIDYDATPIEAEVERTGLDLGAPDRVKQITAIWPRAESAGGTFEVRVGGQYTPGGAITWSAWQPFDASTDERIPVFANGRYLAVGVRSIGGGAWRLAGFELEVNARGRF